MNKYYRGFTLIETLLVLVIISIIIYSSLGYMQQRSLQLRMDRTSTQMQQIANAGLSYYVSNGAWPANLAALRGTYLPPTSVTLKNPWGQDYVVIPSTDPNKNLLYVYTTIVTGSGANRGAWAATTSISGTLPMGYTSTTLSGGIPDPASPCTTSSTTCYVVASVNIPGQNLNNAGAVTFAGLYHHGACVPVPSCPVNSTAVPPVPLTPQVYVAPVQVSGVNDASSDNVYPVSSFTAYAKGPGAVGASPAACDGDTSTINCTAAANNTGSTTNQYWRACLRVVTEKGTVGAGSTGWGQKQTLLAVTRCVIPNEKAGSNFNVFGGN